VETSSNEPQASSVMSDEASRCYSDSSTSFAGEQQQPQQQLQQLQQQQQQLSEQLEFEQQTSAMTSTTASFHQHFVTRAPRDVRMASFVYWSSAETSSNTLAQG